MKTVRYYYKDGRKEVFDKYYEDNGVIRNKKSNIEVAQHMNKNGYKSVVLNNNNGKQKKLLVHRILTSLHHGPPPTMKHTTDHKNRKRTDNSINNLSWKMPLEQNMNQERPDTYKSAFLVVRDGVEKTVKEWMEYLQNEKNRLGRAYTNNIIRAYARRKQNGFTYKVFDDLPGEEWKEVSDSKNRICHWEISNKNRVKYVTDHAQNVLDVSQLCTQDGYPVIGINGKLRKVHIICFQAFYPEEYAVMKPGEIIRHKHDDPMDFRPENLLIGTPSQNRSDAYDNGKYDGTKTARKYVVSYVNDVEEKEHLSLSDAVQYLRKNGWSNALCGNISTAIKFGKKRYGRTWKR
jgi:hypothetical protein